MATPRHPGGRATVPSRATHQYRLEGAILALSKTFRAQVRRGFYTTIHYRALIFVRLISLPHLDRLEAMHAVTDRDVAAAGLAIG
jgi:hypothetical protein